MSESAAHFDQAALLRVLDVTRELSGQYDLAEMLAKVINAGRAVLQADRGSIFLYDDKRRELFTLVATGVSEIRFSVEKGIAGECARRGQVINVPDCYADPRFNPEVDRCTGYHTKCLITIPLIGLDDHLVGVLQMLNSGRGCFDESDEHIAAVLGGHAAVAIQRARLIDERIVKLKLERDLALARQIQMGVLPHTLPPCPGYDLAGFSEPADETGGDIYDVVAIAEQDGKAAGVLLLLADATGHGIGPALSVTQVRAMLRLGLRLSAPLDDLFRHLNDQLTQDLASNRFVTAFIGVLNPKSHHVLYHSAGQAPLLHYHALDQRCEWRDATTLPLGIMEDPPLDPAVPFIMAKGDLLVLLTDGFYEYQNKAGEQLGKERVGEEVTRLSQASAKELLQALQDLVRNFAEGAPQMDDLTAVIVKRAE